MPKALPLPISQRHRMWQDARRLAAHVGLALPRCGYSPVPAKFRWLRGKEKIARNSNLSKQGLQDISEACFQILIACYHLLIVYLVL